MSLVIQSHHTTSYIQLAGNFKAVGDEKIFLMNDYEQSRTSKTDNLNIVYFSYGFLDRSKNCYSKKFTKHRVHVQQRFRFALYLIDCLTTVKRNSQYDSHLPDDFLLTRQEFMSFFFHI